MTHIGKIASIVIDKREARRYRLQQLAMSTITQPERIAAMEAASLAPFKKSRQPKKPGAPRGSVMLQLPVFLEIKAASESRNEPITKLIERAWRVFSAFEGDRLMVPLDQRAPQALQGQ